MPISVAITTKKTQSESEELCEKSLKLLDKVNITIKEIDNLKKLAGADDALIDQLKKQLPELSIPSVEMKEQYQGFIDEFKHDMKAAVLQEKKRQKEIKKRRKKNVSQLNEEMSSRSKSRRPKIKRSRML